MFTSAPGRQTAPTNPKPWLFVSRMGPFDAHSAQPYSTGATEAGYGETGVQVGDYFYAIVYASGDDELHCSRFDGTTWTRRTSAAIQSGASAGLGMTRMMFADSRGYLYISFELASDIGRLYRSTDGGATWTVVDSTEQNDDYVSHMTEDDLGNVYASWYNGTGGEQPVTHIKKSADGETWTAVTINAIQRHIHSIYFCPHRKTLFIGTGDGGADPTYPGMQYSTDYGVTWTDWSGVYQTISMTSDENYIYWSVEVGSTELAYGVNGWTESGSSIFRCATAGGTPEMVFEAPFWLYGLAWQANKDNFGHVIFYYQDGHVVATSDSGETWVETRTTDAEQFTDAAVTAATDTITVTKDWATGTNVRLNRGSATAGDIPAGLAIATDYYVIRVSATAIKLATSLANAVAGTAIDITDAGSGTFEIFRLDSSAWGQVFASTSWYLNYGDEWQYRYYRMYRMYPAGCVFKIDEANGVDWFNNGVSDAGWATIPEWGIENQPCSIKLLSDYTKNYTPGHDGLTVNTNGYAFTAATVSGTPIESQDFESGTVAAGDFDGVGAGTNTYNATPSGSGNPSTYCLRIARTAQTGYVQYNNVGNVMSSGDTAWMKCRIYYDSAAPAAADELLSITNAFGVRIAQGTGSLNVILPRTGGRTINAAASNRVRIPLQTWFYLKVAVYKHATAGYVKVWIDDELVLYATGINTVLDTAWTNAKFGSTLSGTVTVDYDDLFCGKYDPDVPTAYELNGTRQCILPAGIYS